MKKLKECETTHQKQGGKNGSRKMSPTEVGKIIKMRAQSVRLGLQQGKFLFRSGNTKTGWQMDIQYNSVKGL